MSDTITTPGEAVAVGVLLYVASDPRVKAILDVNDGLDRIAEGMRGPWFDNLVARALVAVKEACA